MKVTGTNLDRLSKESKRSLIVQSAQVYRQILFEGWLKIS